MKFLRRLKVKYGIAHPLCMLSLFACLILCAGIIIYAILSYENTSVSDMEHVITGVETKQVLMFLDEIFGTIAQSYSQVVAIGIEPFLAVIVHGFAGLLNAILGLPVDLETTFFSIPTVLLITILFCSVGKVMQCFECTRSFAMLTYGELERVFGYVLLIHITCQNVSKIIYVCEKHKNIIGAVTDGLPVELITGVFIFAISVVSAFVGIMIFYIIKTLVLGLQIMQLSVSVFPFTSLLFEVIRSSITIVVAVFNLLFPRVGFAFNFVAFALGIILLAQTSSSVEYFRVIYIESLLLPYYRFKGDEAELYKDVPKEIYKRCKDRNGLMIPVFSTDKFQLGQIEVTKHEKWWLEIRDEELLFYRKRFFSSKTDMVVIPSSERKWYFRENWHSLELFDLNGPKENIIKLFKKPKKELSFAVSREYEGIYNRITQIMGAEDYLALKQQLTEERRAVLEQKQAVFYTATQ